MHQYKTFAQTLFILSIILNLVSAAPVVPREVHETLKDVKAEDAAGVPGRRRMISPDRGGTAPSQYPSSPPPDGSPTPHLSAMDEVPLRDPTTETSTSAHPLSAADEPGPVPDSNTGVSTSSHPSLAIDRPVSVPGSTAEGSATTHYAQITHDMLDPEPNFKWYQKPIVKKIAGITLLTVVIGGVLAFSAAQNHRVEGD